MQATLSKLHVARSFKYSEVIWILSVRTALSLSCFPGMCGLSTEPTIHKLEGIHKFEGNLKDSKVHVMLSGLPHDSQL